MNNNNKKETHTGTNNHSYFQTRSIKTNNRTNFWSPKCHLLTFMLNHQTNNFSFFFCFFFFFFTRALIVSCKSKIPSGILFIANRLKKKSGWFILSINWNGKVQRPGWYSYQTPCFHPQEETSWIKAKETRINTCSQMSLQIAHEKALALNKGFPKLIYH